MVRNMTKGFKDILFIFIILVAIAGKVYKNRFKETESVYVSLCASWFISPVLLEACQGSVKSDCFHNLIVKSQHALSIPHIERFSMSPDGKARQTSQNVLLCFIWLIVECIYIN